MSKNNIILNKYGAMFPEDLQKLLIQVEGLKKKVDHFEWCLSKMIITPLDLVRRIEKLEKLTNANSYEYVTENKLIKKDKKEC